eukprot:TRINITY_DN10336_c0_g1_i1.p1 TRINITY_DN10336_c0_g1~~TRINITY_DN10336_c0_g1_i1.p1  ORF type:complete len:456 (-),score=74.01 TRINITY_DN10336_c0_g1_i1:149-1330(-)
MDRNFKRVPGSGKVLNLLSSTFDQFARFVVRTIEPPKKGTILFCGRSGAGKSSLINSLEREYHCAVSTSYLNAQTMDEMIVEGPEFRWIDTRGFLEGGDTDRTNKYGKTETSQLEESLAFHSPDLLIFVTTFDEVRSGTFEQSLEQVLCIHSRLVFAPPILCILTKPDVSQDFPWDKDSTSDEDLTQCNEWKLYMKELKADLQSKLYPMLKTEEKWPIHVCYSRARLSENGDHQWGDEELTGIKSLRETINGLMPESMISDNPLDQSVCTNGIQRYERASMRFRLLIAMRLILVTTALNTVLGPAGFLTFPTTQMMVKLLSFWSSSPDRNYESFTQTKGYKAALAIYMMYRFGAITASVTLLATGVGSAVSLPLAVFVGSAERRVGPACRSRC